MREELALIERELVRHATEEGATQPRYLFVMNDIGFLYSHFWELATAIQRAGWVVIIASRSMASPQRALDAGMHFFPLKLKIGIAGPVSELQSVLDLRAAIRSCNPRLVHLISLNVLVGGLLVKKRDGASMLGAITGLGSMFVEQRPIYSVLRPLVMRGLKAAFRNPRSVMALENPDDRNFFIEAGVVSTNASFLIPGAGLAANVILPTTRGNKVPIILCVCRMIREKGITQLIQAAQILHSEGLQFELHLVGDVDVDNPSSLSRNELESLLAIGAAKWLGRRSDVPDLLNKADIFCLPTYYREGLPRSLVEASAAGCAIVTTDVPGCREVVVDGVNGYLVPPRDVEALTNALRPLLCNPEIRAEMGRQARLRFEERFTLEAVFVAFNRCYAALNLPLQTECN